MKSHLSMKLKPNCYWTSTTYHLMSSWDSFKIFFWIWFSITQKQDLDGEEKERKPKILNEHNRALLIMETRFIHDVFSWSQKEYQTHSKVYTPSCSLYTCNINHLLKSGRFLSIVVSTKASTKGHGHSCCKPQSSGLWQRSPQDNSQRRADPPSPVGTGTRTIEL